MNLEKAKQLFADGITEAFRSIESFETRCPFASSHIWQRHYSNDFQSDAFHALKSKKAMRRPFTVFNLSEEELIETINEFLHDENVQKFIFEWLLQGASKTLELEGEFDEPIGTAAVRPYKSFIEPGFIFKTVPVSKIHVTLVYDYHVVSIVTAFPAPNEQEWAALEATRV